MNAVILHEDHIAIDHHYITQVNIM